MKLKTGAPINYLLGLTAAGLYLGVAILAVVGAFFWQWWAGLLVLPTVCGLTAGVVKYLIESQRHA